MYVCVVSEGLKRKLCNGGIFHAISLYFNAYQKVLWMFLYTTLICNMWLCV